MFGLLVQAHWSIGKLVIWYPCKFIGLGIWLALFVPLGKGIVNAETKRQENVKARKAAKKSRKAAH